MFTPAGTSCFAHGRKAMMKASTASPTPTSSRTGSAGADRPDRGDPGVGPWGIPYPLMDILSEGTANRPTPYPRRALPTPIRAPVPGGDVRRQPVTISRASRAVSLGVLPTRTPTASSAACLAAAVPAEPDTIAPAWPMVLPSGAVKPAT